MTAIEQHDKAEFMRQALFYLGVFAVSTVLSRSDWRPPD